MCACVVTLVLAATTNLLACSCMTDFQRIKSIEDVKDYPFVALVKITSETTNPPSDSSPFRDAMLGFKIIEKFKGKDIRELIEYDIQSSCDMGIEVGDEWMLFATERNGKLSIGACSRNVRYRDKDGVRDWHFQRGIRELEDLRKLYGYAEKRNRDGVDKQYYSDGKLEVETSYSHGLKNGLRTIYHRNGKVLGKQMFMDDSLQGKSEWFFPSGQLYDQKFYRKDVLINVSRVYYDTTVTDRMKKFLIRDFYKTEDSLRKTYSRVQVWLEALYDYNGQIVASKEYSRWGVIQRENIYHFQDSIYTSVFYHDNGQVHTVNHFKDYTTPTGHYQEYDPEGNPTKSWDYDANGKQINIHIPK
ncbi:toxin-antitoxin system YwqK family antitoxin [Dyadobacter sp. OTU695]|uniref:toxin-antitoxin system YwqK family antitoxin n=1 Tax=Dyadobacter sp. OTU695 TaxID=3043860 RepID=UPI00313C8325